MSFNQITKRSLAFQSTDGEPINLFAASAALSGVGCTGISGICVDRSGTVYVADSLNHVIVKITNNGTPYLLAGTPGVSGDNDSTPVSGADALFNGPRGIACDNNGNIYVADSGNNQIRKIYNGNVYLLAGSADADSGSDNAVGNPLDAKFNNPTDLKVDGDGSVYVVDTDNNMIRVVRGTNVFTVAGNGSAGDDDDLAGACLDSPRGLVLVAPQTIYIADTGNFKIKYISGFSSIHTFSGSGTEGDTLGDAASTEYNNLIYMDKDQSGCIYVVNFDANGDSQILKIDKTGKPHIANDFSNLEDSYLNSFAIDKSNFIYIGESTEAGLITSYYGS